MNKELSELLKTLRECLLLNKRITLSTNQVRLIVRYINELEKEISEGADN